MIKKFVVFNQNTTLLLNKTRPMNDLILILTFYLSICFSLEGQVVLTGDAPVITLNSNDTSIQNADAWGGDLCIFMGDPSQAVRSQGINFTVTDADTPANMISATVTSSNTNVVPILIEFLKITYTVSASNPNEANLNIMINPFSTGLTDIVISLKDKDKNTMNYYIDLTVKECQDVLTIDQTDIDAINPPINAFHFNYNVFQAANLIETSGIPANSANGPIVRFNDNIVFNAGNSIELNPGFEVVRRGLFLAEIKDCDN